MSEDGLLVISFYPFFHYDCVIKMRLRMNNARRVVKCGSLQELLDAGKVKNQDPYAIYGSQVPCVVPGSKQYWKTFGLDLVTSVQQRGLLDFFCYPAFDGWPHMQSALARGWGTVPNECDVEDLARRIENRQPVGSHPQYSIIAAEKRFLWVMNVLKSENGPLGTVEDCLEKGVSEKGGSSLVYATLGETWYST